MYREDEKTKLTLSQGGTSMTWEGDPGAGLTEILDGFIGCLRGLTFGEWVVGRIAEYCAELKAESASLEKPDFPDYQTGQEPLPELPEEIDVIDGAGDRWAASYPDWEIVQHGEESDKSDIRFDETTNTQTR